MKKILLISLLLPSISFASVKGIGEYFYGPDTSDNVACYIAEEKAKEDAVQNFVGQSIESRIDETCLTNECFFTRETSNSINGTIEKILDKKISKTTDFGQKICTVEILAQIKQYELNLSFEVKGFNSIFKENSEVNFYAITNTPGKILVFNHYLDSYHKIYESEVEIVDSEFSIPSKDKLYATLPKGKITSKEKLVFVFTTLDIKTKKVYNEFEMKNFIGNIPIKNRVVINRFVQIVR